MKNDRNSIAEGVMTAVATVTGMTAAELRPDTELVIDLCLDSLGMFELVIDLEEVYDLKISDEDIDRIHTIDDIINYIFRQTGNDQ